MTRLFPPNKNDDKVAIFKIIQKPRKKTSSSSLIDRETRAMTGSNKPRLQYINNTASSHCYIHKILNTLQSGNYLGLTKA